MARQLDTNRRTWWIERLRSLTIVLPASFVLGALTSIGQLLLPDALSSVANSSGGWSTVVFALIWAARCRPLLGAIGGVLSFLLLNVGYAAMSELRGYSYSLGLDNPFVILSFLAGPFVGLAAAWMRSPSRWLAAVASALLPAILIGEGFYGLTVIADSTSPVYWTLSVAGGAVFLGAASVRKLRMPGAIILASVLTVLGATLFWFGYGAAGSVDL